MKLSHPEFGDIEIKINPRAKRFVFRFGNDGRLQITVPKSANEKELRVAIDKMSPKLRQLKEKSGAKKVIDADFSINQPDFKMALREGQVPRVQARMSDGTLNIIFPHGTQLLQDELQEWLIKVTEEAIRHQAKLILPKRIKVLAQQLGLTINSVTIRNSHGRWGSCSSKKNINLSMYLILLPRHLQDYVMKHELTHTLHMDHSTRFWNQLDIYCGQSSQALRKEMAAYDTSVFFRR